MPPEFRERPQLDTSPRGRGQALFGLGGVARIHCGGRHPGGGAHLAARGGAKKSGTRGWRGEGGGNACLNLTQIRQCSPLPG